MAATRKAKEKETKSAVEEKITAPVAEPTATDADVPTATEAEPPVVVRSFEGYIGAIGRRKTSYASARISNGTGGITVNGKPHTSYFPTEELRLRVEEPLKKLNVPSTFSVSIVVRGGGIHSQADAVRHAIARSLVKYDSELRKRIKRWGYLKRDPRAKERRKFGLKKARKAPQWAKR